MGLDQTEEIVFSKKYALLIGVDQFADPSIPKLPGVSKDLQNFAKLLLDSSFSSFVVRDPLINPSLIEARKAISEISKDAKENDVVLFYYSGHGSVDRNTRSFYLLYKDSETDFQDATCMESEYILSQFRKSVCKNFIIIIDSCYSGAFFNNNRGLPNGLVALTACDEHESAAETQDGGVFSNIIIRGLRSDYIDANRDGMITFSELFDFITEEIKTSFHKCTPKKWEWNVHQDICLFQSPRPVFISYQRKQAPLVKQISEALRKNDISTFVDQEKLRIGDNWEALLESNIKNCRAFIYILDKDILHSKVADWELSKAKQHKVPILPILVEKLKLPVLFENKYGRFNRMFFDHSDFEASIRTIIDHIKSIRIKQKPVKPKAITKR